MNYTRTPCAAATLFLAVASAHGQTTRPTVPPPPGYAAAAHAAWAAVGNMADLPDPADRERVRPGLTKAFYTFLPLQQAYHQAKVRAGDIQDPPTPEGLARQAASTDVFYRVLLVTVGDDRARAVVDDQVGSADPQVALIGRCTLALSGLLIAPTPAGQLHALDRMDGLLKSAPADARGTGFTPVFNAVMDCLMVMTDPAADRAGSLFQSYAPPEVAQRYADQRFSVRYVGKPMALSGTTPEGVALDTADQYRGKVVLVDFWASWCGPCKAELPRVKALYAKYHAQGFEVLGVSNDVRRDALVSYLEANPLPWPSLFDPAAAAEQRWHPLTQRYKIKSIPQMFLIDRAGVLRTVRARSEMEMMIPKLLAEATPTAAAN